MRFFLLLSIFYCFTAQAGHIELSNGDRLMGDLVRIDGDHVIWKSANFGEQRIHKHKIKDISSSTPLKINGNAIPCILEGMENENLVYYCGLRSRMSRVSLLSIEAMTPFDDFVADKYIYTGRLALWGAYVRGNEIRDEWNIQAELSMRRGEWRHNFKGEYAEASWVYSDPSLKWNTRYTLDWFFRERWFWYNNITLGEEQQRGLDSYVSLGSGSGHQFWESQETALAIRAGVAYFDEQYGAPVIDAQGFDPGDTFGAAQLAMDFRYTLPLGVSFFHNNELIQSLESGESWHLTSATGLSAMVVGKVHSEIKLDYNVDNEPQPGRQARDKRMSVGVSYKW